MSGAYFGYIASAYAISAVALAALGTYIFLDARAAQKSLKAIEVRTGRRVRRRNTDA